MIHRFEHVYIDNVSRIWVRQTFNEAVECATRSVVSEDSNLFREVASKFADGLMFDDNGEVMVKISKTTTDASGNPIMSEEEFSIENKAFYIDGSAVLVHEEGGG